MPVERVPGDLTRRRSNVVADDRAIEEEVRRGILTTTLERAVNWARKQSTWGVTFGLACCAIEMMSAGTANYDLARWGMEIFRASPRQADLMIVAGRVSTKMAPVLRQVYDQMAEPKWVISMGVCASTGGMFNNYAIVQGVDQIVPVDVYAPGCPPTPETLIHAITTLHQLSADNSWMTQDNSTLGGGIFRHVEARVEAIPSPAASGTLAALALACRRRRGR